MQQRIWILLIVGGVMAIAAAGWFLFSSDDKTISEPVNITVNETTSQTIQSSKQSSGQSLGQSSNQSDAQPEAQDPAEQGDTAKSASPKTETDTDTDTETGTEIEQAAAAQPADQNAADVPATAQPAEEEASSLVFAITVARVNPDGSAVFAGVAEPGATIQLQDGAVLIDETIADANGEWVSLPPEKLAPGAHLIVLTMRTKDGRIARADTSLVVEIAASLDEKPLVALVPQTDEAAPALLQSPDSDAAIEVVNEEVQDIIVPATEPAVSIQSLAFLSETDLQIRGQYAAGNTVRGRLADIELSEATISANGTWSAIADISALGTRPQSLQIELLDEYKEVVASTEMMLDRANLSAGLDGSDMVVVQRGDALWRIAYRTYGEGVRYVEIFRRNQDQISDPNLIYPNQIFVVPK